MRLVRKKSNKHDVLHGSKAAEEVWDLNMARLEPQLQSGKKGRVQAVCVSPD